MGSPDWAVWHNSRIGVMETYSTTLAQMRSLSVSIQARRIVIGDQQEQKRPDWSPA